jgi:DNA-binding MarR family transcriptional regulator
VAKLIEFADERAFPWVDLSPKLLLASAPHVGAHALGLLTLVAVYSRSQGGPPWRGKEEATAALAGLLAADPGSVRRGLDRLEELGFLTRSCGLHPDARGD